MGYRDDEITAQETFKKLNAGLKAIGSDIVFTVEKSTYSSEVVAKLKVTDKLRVVYSIKNNYGWGGSKTGERKDYTIVFKLEGGYYLDRGNRVTPLPYNINLKNADWNKIASVAVNYVARASEAFLRMEATEKIQKASEQRFDKAFRQFKKETGLKGSGSFGDVEFKTSVGTFTLSESGESLRVEYDSKYFRPENFDELKQLVAKLQSL